MHAPAQQDVNKNALRAQVGSSPLHNCPTARWSGDLAFRLNVSETLNPVIHPLGKDSQMLVLNIHFYSNLAAPNGTNHLFSPKGKSLGQSVWKYKDSQEPRERFWSSLPFASEQSKVQGPWPGGGQSWWVSSGLILAVLESGQPACRTSGVTFHLEPCNVTHPATVWNWRVLELPGAFSPTCPVLTGENEVGLMN